MTEPKYRIIPAGLSGWRVQEFSPSVVSYHTGILFWRKAHTAVIPGWDELYLVERVDDSLRSKGIRIVTTHKPNGWSEVVLPWPRDKNEIKKILDEEIQTYRNAEEMQKKIQHRLATTPIEEYP